MPEYHQTKEEMLKDLLIDYVRKIRMNIFVSIKDLDELEDQITRRFKTKGTNARRN